MSISRHVFLQWGAGIAACFTIAVVIFWAVQYGAEPVERPLAVKNSNETQKKQDPPAVYEKIPPLQSSSKTMGKHTNTPLSKEQSNDTADNQEGAIRQLETATKLDKTPSVYHMTPSFDVVRVTPDGETVIAGRAAPHQSISILNKGRKISEDMSDDTGHFAITLATPLPHGSSDLSIESISKDGKERTISEQHIIVSIPETDGEFFVGLLEPGKPLAILDRQTVKENAPKKEAVKSARTATPSANQEAGTMETASTNVKSTQNGSHNNAPKDEIHNNSSPQITIDAVEVEDGRMFIAGSAEKGANIRFYVDDIFVGQSRAGAGGRFLLEAAGNLSAGAHRIRADQVDGASGKVMARVEVPFNRASDDAIMLTKGDAQKDKMDVGQSATDMKLAAQATSQANSNAVTMVESANAEPSDAANHSPSPTVIIRRGDNLWRISRRHYGRGIRYSVIYDANRNQIKDPHWIFPGQVFDLPSNENAHSPSDISNQQEDGEDNEVQTKIDTSQTNAN